MEKRHGDCVIETYIQRLGAVARQFCWQLVEQKIFHVTSRSAFAEITKANCVKPSSGKLPGSFPQTVKSFARRNNYISLFDFVHCSPEKVELMSNIWRPIVAKHNPTILICFDAGSLADKLILNDSLGDGFADPEFMSENYYVPRVEAWYPESLNLDLVTESYEIYWRNSTFNSLRKSGA